MVRANVPASMDTPHPPTAGPTERDGAHLGGRVLTALAVALVVAIGAVLAFVHPRYLLGILAGDDAGYYLAVARNAVLGHGFSFDRIEPTNGFNPLMPALLIPLDRVLVPGLDLVACFRTGVLVTWAAMAWALVSAHGLATRVLDARAVPAGDRALGAGALLWFLAAFVAPKGYYGMDAFLALAFGLAYAAAVAKRGPLAPGARAALRDALLLAGAVLARIDTLPLAAAAFVVMLAEAGTDRAQLRRLAVRAGLFLASILPYLAWNRIAFGDWLPISARIKSSFPHWDPGASLRAVLHTSLNPADVLMLFLALGTGLAWIGAVLARREWRAPGPAASAMAILALAVTGRIGWLLLFSRLDVQGSYFILAHPFVALAALVAGARMGGRRGVAVASLAIALVGAALLAAKLRAALPEVRAIAAGVGDEWALGRRIHDAVAPSDVVYGGAFGLIGYISDRAWINGDGVANTQAYQDAIRDGRLASHLASRSVDWIVVTASPPRPLAGDRATITAESLLHGTVDSIAIAPGDAVLEARMRRNGGTALWLVRWAGPDQASPAPSLPRQPSR